MINKTHYIYGLFDPLTGEVRYIGRTVNLKKRLMEHMGKHTNDIKSAWINALEKAGERPQMATLETATTLDDAKHIEHQWIRRCLDGGADLTNGAYPGYTRGGRRQRKHEQG